MQSELMELKSKANGKDQRRILVKSKAELSEGSRI